MAGETDEPRRRRRGRAERAAERPEVLKSGGPELVRIPAGEGWIGASKGDPYAEPWEMPRHRVTFAKSFGLGRYAVTFGEYDAFCEATGRRRPRDLGFGRGRRPVLNVTYADAGAYCEWLNDTVGPGWRLPSEAEWEYACRAGSLDPYNVAYGLNPDLANYDPTDGAGGSTPRGSRQQTVEVGDLPANAWGLYEMHGNVWEWCADRWNDHYDGAPDDSAPWRRGDETKAPARGGSWMNEVIYLRSSTRLGLPRDTKSARVGFRVARTLVAR